MKHALPALLLSLGFSPGITASQWPGDARASGQVITGKPNVIIVLSDDQGYGDFSCHGNPVLKTPALDRLHNEGIRFGNFNVIREIEDQTWEDILAGKIGVKEGLDKMVKDGNAKLREFERIAK